MLENVSGFEDISIAQYLKTQNYDALKNISSDSLLSYYQKLGNFGDNVSKINLRDTLLTLEDTSIAKIRDSLELQAFLESLDTGLLKDRTKNYLESKGINTNDFTTKFMSGAKNDINTFRETLSG